VAGEKARRRARPDAGSFGGLLIAVAGIIGGYLLERGDPRGVIGPSAALIVLGGSIGATLVASPLELVRRAWGRLHTVFFERADDLAELAEQLVGFATKARREGIISIESQAMAVEDPFLRKAVLLAVDGIDLGDIRTMMELEIDVAEQRAEQEAKVFEAAGGFAPTIGIIGAVLGLIIVMNKLSDMTAVGHGIAAAFVATIYGVGAANLFFLPAAQKIRMRSARESERRQMMLEGVLGIVEGLNPKLLRMRLEPWTPPAGERGQRTAAAAKTVEA
jgi:chemotaxis protein MotA